MIFTISVTTGNIPTTGQTMIYGVLAVITLIAFLGLKEILSSEELKNQQIKAFISGLNIVIIPLLIVFLCILVYKVVTTLKIII
ncbi:hypothetical protein [Methanothermobacter tenebrarum]|uniref:Uncharacterized protein n=1 Tax=Methanothermobacter tenebrarum TaxID=680118 RepID=A0A328PE61_9EURY|nr:hypothetical protein [Methanothermobacter tenebrarum]NPV64801.1 hypothetical protein [Methanobacteriaceae archaeon]RAO78642.1 hypothetical protein DPC56_07230 [Methanothermobacter tenebrarum]